MKDLNDTAFMHMSYELAHKAKGWASPNPNVGAVLVKNNTIIGQGYHKMPGKSHAEIIALQEAGAKAKNSTMYVTLEPCVHWGRTPPCVDTLIQAGLKRAVISSYDPNPLVYKKGIKQLKTAGIDVSVGLLEEKNFQLNESYIKFITQNIPFVTAKAAVSLDGKIATRTGSSKWISSSKTREYMHLLRGEHDALLIGIQTLLTDDPVLTVRHPHWKGKQMVRIVIDTRLRFPLKAKILETLSSGEILILTGRNINGKKEDTLKKMGVQIIKIPGASQKINMIKALQILGQKGISSVFVEGGGKILTSLIEKRLIDKMFVTISPKLIGGTKAPSLFQGKGVEKVGDALCLKKTRNFIIDEDIIMEGYF